MREIKEKSFFLVIPTRDRKEHVINLLGDLIPFDRYISNCIVVDQSEDFIGNDFNYNNYPYKITLVRGNREQGVNNSRNIALKYYNEEDWLFFLDDDLRVRKEELDKIPKVLAGNSIDVIVLGNNEDRKITKLKNYTHLLESIAKPNNPSSIRMRFQVSSGLSIVDKLYFFKAGFYFDEIFTFWGDDWDFGFRLMNAGAMIQYYPDINFTHLALKSGGQRRYKSRNKIERQKKFLQLHFYKKHFSSKALHEKFIIELLSNLKNFQFSEAIHLWRFYRKIK